MSQRLQAVDGYHMKETLTGKNEGSDIITLTVEYSTYDYDVLTMILCPLIGHSLKKALCSAM